MLKDPIFISIICMLAVLTAVGLGYVAFKIIRFFRKAYDEKPMTFDEELKANMLPTGLYIITGRQRAGKGALGCAIMDTDATYHADERFAYAQSVIDRLNEEDDYNLELPSEPPLLYYSKNKMLLTEDYLETYHTDVLDVALPNGNKNDVYFPPFSLIHLEEMDAVMNARTWKDNPEKKADVIDAYKWIGHDDKTVIGDAQVFARLDAAVRALATDIFYIIKRRDFYRGDMPRKWWQFSHKHDNEIVRTEWTFLWIKNQLKQQADDVNKYGDFISMSDYIKKCTFNYYGNIYERYNSKSGRAYWYKGISNFNTARHPAENMSREAVEDYCARNARHAEKASKETENGNP